MNKVTSVALSAVIGGALVVGLASPSHAATSLRAKALGTATAQKGDSYEYGAAGPSRFDCSGLVYYSYRKNGRTLPRTAQDQYNKASKVAASARKKGDLIFIGKSGSSIYHVGIYAGFWSGYGWILDSPKPGRTVGFHKIKDYTAGSPKAYYARYNG